MLVENRVFSNPLVNNNRWGSTIANIFTLFFFTTEPGPWPTGWRRRSLQKIVCLLAIQLRYTQTDRQTDRQAEKRSR